MWSESTDARCPKCQQLSSRVHGYYWRKVQGLPISGCFVELHIRMRRYRCYSDTCLRQTFTAQPDPIVTPYCRRSLRVIQTLTQLGLELGGQAGVRVAQHCRLSVSCSTLLRLIRKLPDKVTEPPRIIGIDDWAYCRGERYGTIIVDLEKQGIIDLLPDTQITTVANWLRSYPEVEIITRDRGKNYQEATRQGAPQAIHVADRWHLVKNMGDALKLDFDKQIKLLKKLVHKVVEDEVHQRLQQVQPKAIIARQLGIDRKTVYKYAKLETLPVKQSPKFKPRLIDPFRGYIAQRLEQQDSFTKTILQEIQKLGYTGHKSTFYKAVAEIRKHRNLSRSNHKRVTYLQSGALVKLVLQNYRTLEQQDVIDRACQLHPELSTAIGLAQDFLIFTRQQKPQHLIAWIEAVQLTSLTALKRFATGLLDDFGVVYEACCQEWSNGQIEGQINKLKFIKRQMYGRANFDLLRLRLLNLSQSST